MNNTEAPQQRTPLEQLRLDFAVVFGYWLMTKVHTDEQDREERRLWGLEIRRHKDDAGWMACIQNHFRQMAGNIVFDREATVRDMERSARIRAEIAAATEPSHG